MSGSGRVCHPTALMCILQPSRCALCRPEILLTRALSMGPSSGFSCQSSSQWTCTGAKSFIFQQSLGTSRVQGFQLGPQLVKLPLFQLTAEGDLRSGGVRPQPSQTWACLRSTAASTASFVVEALQSSNFSVSTSMYLCTCPCIRAPELYHVIYVYRVMALPTPSCPNTPHLFSLEIEDCLLMKSYAVEGRAFCPSVLTEQGCGDVAIHPCNLAAMIRLSSFIW